MLVDSHCHLDFDKLSNELDDVVARASNAGIETMVTISTKLSKFDRVLEIAECYPNIYCSVGVHPHEAADEMNVTADHLIKIAEHPKVIAIGETGLDYYYEHSPREKQKELFRRHIDAARQTGLPLVVHTRDAEADTCEILEDEAGKGTFPGLIHCFTSTQDLATRSLALGLYISISGIVTFNSAKDIQEVVRHIPKDRLLVETDAPYLAPVPKRGKSNEPAFVVHTAAKVAELQHSSPEEIAQTTTDNFFSLFSKAKRPS